MKIKQQGLVKELKLIGSIDEMFCHEYMSIKISIILMLANIALIFFENF